MKIKPTRLGALMGSLGFLVLAGAVVVGMGSMRARNTYADDGSAELDAAESFVTIYDAGEKTVVKAGAMTVREVLERVEIGVDEDVDIVEPGLDEAVQGRNYYINIYRGRPAVVIDGPRVVKLMSAATVPRDVATAAGVELYPEDVVKITTANKFLASGVPFSYVVVRAKLVKFNFYGAPTEVRTQARTVGELLTERGVEVGEEDWLSLSVDEAISDGIELALHRNGKTTVVVEEAVAYGEKIIYDYAQPVGHREVRTEGVEGRKTVTYEIEMYEGQETARTKISEMVTAEPVEAEVVIGKKSNVSTTSATENEGISWKYFRAQGFSREQTAGIMGNLMQEHRFNTSDAKGGCGIVQWTGARRTALQAKANWESIYVQLDYVMEELNGKYAGVKNALLGAGGVEEAVRIFQNQYERCGICRESQRIQYAYEIMWRHEE